ncbi:MAG: amidohydrolase family protein [Ornithinimicrobium sp.]
MSDVVVHGARLVPLDAAGAATAVSPHSDELSDILIRGGAIEAVAPAGTLTVGPSVPVLRAQGRWAIPGLWDQHVHMTQWAMSYTRLDTSGVQSSQQACDLVGQALRNGAGQTPTGMLTGLGHRCAEWAHQPTVAELDAVSGSFPVVLISGDCHHGWVNSAAQAMLGVAPRDDVIAEDEWFDLYAKLDALPGAEEETEASMEHAVRRAHEQGVVGIVDLEFARPWEQWAQRYAAGIAPLRVRTGVYPARLEEIIALGWSTGTVLPGTDGLVTQGPLKIISDGSLNTRTAWCCEPYADGAALAHPAGKANFSVQEMVDLVSRGHAHGLTAALHAIGDAAVSAVLDVFEASGASGTVEHAQLLRSEDLSRWSALPVTASVQPAHLLDDRSVTEQCWPDRMDRAFMVADLLRHGIPVVLGSDAPVARLDPWRTMAAAVHRGPLDGPSWHDEQALTAQQALAASVDGQRLAPGGRGDLVLVDADPLQDGSARDQAARLSDMSVGATVVAGRIVAGQALAAGLQ